MGHNVIIGKSYGGHFEFMQIKPLMKEGFWSPPNNITKCIIGSPCAKFREFILKCTWCHGDCVHGTRPSSGKLLFGVDRHLSLVLWIKWNCRQDRCPREDAPNGDSAVFKMAGQTRNQNR